MYVGAQGPAKSHIFWKMHDGPSGGQEKDFSIFLAPHEERNFKVR